MNEILHTNCQGIKKLSPNFQCTLQCKELKKLKKHKISINLCFVYAKKLKENQNIGFSTKYLKCY